MLLSLPRVEKHRETLRQVNHIYRSADKSLTRPERKEARKHVRDEHDFNNIETRAVTKFFFLFLQGKAPKEIHAILTEMLACLLPGPTKDLSASLYISCITENLAESRTNISRNYLHFCTTDDDCGVRI